MVVRSVYSSRKAPILWAIIFFFGAAATGRCVLGFSLYRMWKENETKQNKILLIKAAIHYKLVKFARSNTQSYPAALWSTDQSTPDN